MLAIYNEQTDQYESFCTSGSSCGAGGGTNWGMQSDPPSLSYRAELVDFGCLCAIQTREVTVHVIRSTIHYSVQLNLVKDGNSWDATATVDPSVSGTGYWIGIANAVTGDGVNVCSTGTTCTATVGKGIWQAEVLTDLEDGYVLGSDTESTDDPNIMETTGGPNPSTNQCCGQASAGDPVNPSDGEYWETADDLSIPGRGLALDMSRTYSSIDAETAPSPGPLGYGWSFPYAMSLSGSDDGAQTVNQENGSIVRFTPDGNGGYQAPSRVLATLQHNGDGSWTFVRRKRTSFTFDADGKLISEADLNGNQTTLDYDSDGLLQTVTDPSGRELSFAYDSNDRIASVTDSADREVDYGYTDGELTDVTDVGGGSWHYTYDSDHRLLTVEDPRSHTITTNTYDSSGRVATQTDALDRETAFDYSGSTTTVTKPSGSATEYDYTDGLLSQKTEGVGTSDAATWSYEYDPDTLGLTSVTDPNDNQTTFEYDSDGNLTSTTDALDHTTSYTYDSLNDRTSVTDPSDVTTTLDYDSNGNLTQVSTPLSGTSPLQHRVVSYAHDDSSHPDDVTSVTDPDGNTTDLSYDEAGDLTSSTDAAGDQTTFGHNSIGERTSMVAPKGNASGADPGDYTTTYAYNDYGDPTTVTDPLGHETDYGYDADRNLTSLTDPLDHETDYTYDAANQLTEITRADTSTLQNGYDDDGNLASQTDGASNTTSYAYDPLERLASVTDPLNRSTTYAYDGAGNLTGLTDPLNRSTTFGHDDANRLTSIDYSDSGTPDASFGYDADNRRTSMSDGSGDSSFDYDSLGRLTSATNGNDETVGYAYDLADNLTTLSYPGSVGDVQRTYDDANRLASVTDPASRETDFAYDRDSNLTSIDFPSATGETDTYSFNHADQMSSAQFSNSGGNLATLDYTRDADGQLTEEDQTGLPGASSISYTYTPLNQLASAGGHAYNYDAAGNPTELDDHSGYQYDDANELTDIPSSAPAGAATLSYDDLGQRTQLDPAAGPTVDYGYDQAGRLTSLGSGTFTYDGDSLRQSASDGTTTKHFSWDHSSDMPLALSDGSTTYIYGPNGLPIEDLSSGGTPTYYHQDQLGSTRMLTGSTGLASGTASYQPFGSLEGSTGGIVASFGFAGQYQDETSGLQYLRSRFYDPARAQFLTNDPLAVITRSRYGYAGDDPLNRQDPGGLSPTLPPYLPPFPGAPPFPGLPGQPSVPLPPFVHTPQLPHITLPSNPLAPLGHGAKDLVHFLPQLTNAPAQPIPTACYTKQFIEDPIGQTCLAAANLLVGAIDEVVWAVYGPRLAVIACGAGGLAGKFHVPVGKP